MGEPPKPHFYDSAMFWLAVCAVTEVVGGIPVGAVIVQVVGNPKIDVFSSGWFWGGAAVMGIGILAAWWALTLFVANFHVRRWQRGSQVAPGSIVNNYNAPVYQYGVQPVSPSVQNVSGGVHTAATTPPPTSEATLPTEPENPQPPSSPQGPGGVS